jgi:hypothetical protein
MAFSWCVGVEYNPIRVKGETFMHLRAINCAWLQSYERCRTELTRLHDYSDKKLETINMPVTQRCNYAGPLGKLIPTRSIAFILLARLLGALPRFSR